MRTPPRRGGGGLARAALRGDARRAGDRRPQALADLELHPRRAGGRVLGNGELPLELRVRRGLPRPAHRRRHLANADRPRRLLRRRDRRAREPRLLHGRRRDRQARRRPGRRRRAAERAALRLARRGEGAAGARGEPQDQTVLARLVSSTPEHFDAVVVGSGFGGSVTAFRLAEGGLRVCLLERGKAYPPGSFARTPYDMARNFWDPSDGKHGLFDLWTFKGLEALVSSGLGGGSLIYANVLIDRKSTCLNSSHVKISYAVFGLKKKKVGERGQRLGHDGRRLGPAVELLEQQ